MTNNLTKIHAILTTSKNHRPANRTVEPFAGRSNNVGLKMNENQAKIHTQVSNDNEWRVAA